MFQIERLVQENNGLKQDKLELADKTSKLEQELKKSRVDMEKVEAACFNSMSEADMLRKKEGDRIKAENEVIELRKEVLLLGEMLRKYREQSKAPKIIDHERDRMIKQAFENQLSTIQSTLISRTNEMEVLKGKNQELQDLLSKKDQVVQEQKKLCERIREDAHEGKKEIENLYKDVVSANMHLESKILELQDQLSKASNKHSGYGRGARSSSIQAAARPTTISPTSPGFGEVLSEATEGIIPSTPHQRTFHSANVDIAKRQVAPVVQTP